MTALPPRLVAAIDQQLAEMTDWINTAREMADLCDDRPKLVQAVRVLLLQSGTPHDAALPLAVAIVLAAGGRALTAADRADIADDMAHVRREDVTG